MKLIIAIVQDQDEIILTDAFREANIRATKLSTTGGFLKAGNTTFMIGLEADRVDEALDIIKRSSSSRERFVASPISLDVSMDMAASYPVKVQVGGATVFVLPIEAFHQF